jgi:hypothetical protein
MEPTMVRPHPSTTQIVAEMIRRDEFARLSTSRRLRPSRLALPARVAALLVAGRARLCGARPVAPGLPGIAPNLPARRSRPRAPLDRTAGER